MVRNRGKTRHLYWDIWQGHNLCPLQKKIRTYRLLCAPLSSCIESGDLTSPAVDLSLLFSFPLGHRWDHPVPVGSAGRSRTQCWFVVVMLLQWGAASKSTSNRALKDQVLQRADGGECPSQDRSSAPRGASMGTRAAAKRTVSFSESNSVTQFLLQVVRSPVHGDLMCKLLFSSHL